MLATLDQRTDARVRPYAEACMDVASDPAWPPGRVACVDLYTPTAGRDKKTGSAASNQDFFSDGFHLNGRGNALAFDLVLSSIRTHLGTLPSDQPLWEALVGLSPEQMRHASLTHVSTWHPAQSRGDH